ncbi:MAG: hypothetical protein H7Z43_03590 [Clostridia bacterium]|nr:hypothetical protein [Deltaproteobacteria bacterium]
MLRYLKARWALGNALMRRVLLAPVLPDHGPKPWLGKLATENLAAVPEELWSYIGGTSRCIGCGLCDAVARGNESPASWIANDPREPSTANIVLDHAKRLSEMAVDIARICPARVPVEDIARLIRANAETLAELRR